ncbi:hypothetical protein C8F04DRAFT_1078837 [Mycena alexandri]|uniref:Ketoreductase domain-containing protein n=1 Tax=Mycena alexandri TaxID=1745969 RepID=A0AAD6T967_9AGAR|nr:hypothetical protein C8F04DRAFT_1078837 [Mycena alexandri]
MSSPTAIVLITGANKGIGLAIAGLLAKEHDGYHILLGSRDSERGRKAAESLQREGLSVEALTVDVTDEDSIAAAVRTVKFKFGRLDVLINNAGVALDIGKDIVTTRSMFDETFAVNFFGPAAVTEAFIPLLEQSTAARIVFVTSDLASLTMRADPQGRDNHVAAPAYRSSKSALNMLALGYAHRFRDRGWKVNMDNPGFTPTDMTGGRGTRTLEEGARNAVRLATLGEDGPTGTYSEREGLLPW